MIWDFTCPQCQYTEERNVKSDERDEQVCLECSTLMERACSSPSIHVISQEDHIRRMKQRSIDHTQKSIQEGRSLSERDNGNYQNTNAGWYGHTRSKNHRRGIVQEKLNEWNKIDAAGGFKESEPTAPRLVVEK